MLHLFEKQVSDIYYQNYTPRSLFCFCTHKHCCLYEIYTAPLQQLKPLHTRTRRINNMKNFSTGSQVFAIRTVHTGTLTLIQQIDSRCTLTAYLRGQCGHSMQFTTYTSRWQHLLPQCSPGEPFDQSEMLSIEYNTLAYINQTCYDTVALLLTLLHPRANSMCYLTKSDEKIE